MNIFLKNTVVLSLLNIFSKITGLIRDMLTAAVLGTSALSDCYLVALRIVDFIKIYFSDGLFSQATLSKFTQLSANNKQDGNNFINLLTSISLLILTGITIAMIFLAYPILSLILTNISPDMIALSADFLRIMLPSIILTSFCYIIVTMLYSIRSFTPTGILPIIKNLTIIFFLSIGGLFHSYGHALSISVLVASFIQVIFINIMAKSKFNIKFRLSGNKKECKQLIKTQLPSLIFILVQNISELFNLFLASWQSAGIISYFYYAKRIIYLPFSLFTINLTTIIFPQLCAKANKQAGIKDSVHYQNICLCLSLTLIIPSTMGLIILAQSIAECLFGYGKVTDNDISNITQILRVLSCILILMTFKTMLINFLLAHQKMHIICFISMFVLVLNIIIKLIATNYYGYIGIAIGEIIVMMIDLIILYTYAITTKQYYFNKEVFYIIAKIIISTSIMAIILNDLSGISLTSYKIINLIYNILLAIIVFTISIYLLNIKKHYKKTIIEI